MSNEKHGIVTDEMLNAIELPIGLERMIAGIIMDRLDKAGIYYHYRFRIKSNESIKHKFAIKEFNENHMIQDKVGIKFIFCFVDDLKIAEKIINEACGGSEENWAKSRESEDGFSATKINGVFRIPQHLIRPDTREAMHSCFIDDTFEIQLKTMLFDGWHETDHDLRYKNEELWEMFPQMNRKLNRILATLEQCDDSVIGVFDKLTYRTYLRIKEAAAGDPDYKVSPVTIERVAQCHLRLRMKESFPYKERDSFGQDLEENAEEKELTEKIMREHFYERFRKMFLASGFEKNEAESKAQAMTDKVVGMFLSVAFLKQVLKYDRSRLINSILKYKNNFSLDIFSICALICSEPKNTVAPGESGYVDEETIACLRRYLRRRYIRYKEAVPIPVRRCIEYPTYQCLADIYPANREDRPEDLFKKLFRVVAMWMDNKIGYDEHSSDERRKVHAFAGGEMPDTDRDFFVYETGGFDFRILYIKEYDSCAFRLTEPDNKYEEKFDSGMDSLSGNRNFTTDIGLRMVKDENGFHAELAVRTSCKEPDRNLGQAAAFRTGFIKRIYSDTENFVMREHGVADAFAWRGNVRKLIKIDSSDEVFKELIDSPNRQMPVVVVPKKAFMDPDFGVASLTSSLCGYGHVIVDESDDGEAIVIYYPKKESLCSKPDMVLPDFVDDMDGNAKSYVYAWKEIYAKVSGFSVGKRISFGDVMLYRELKDAYYRQQGESVAVLKEQIKNLKRELDELRG